MFDLIIKGGKVVDGSGNPWYSADVAVHDGRIASLGRVCSEADRILDAKGLIVAPGFVDTHSHSDLMLLVEPEARQKILQGVTTEVVGQDGLGEAPLRDDIVDEWRRYLSGLNGDPNIEWSWRSFKEYLDRLEAAGPATNVASLVGHGNLRLLTMGMENRSPTLSELGEMKELLKEAMQQGAFGLSTGLIYPPCVFADTTELVELCKVVSKYGGLFVVHMRNEGDRLLESIDEVVKVGREAIIPVHISHFKASGERNWGKVKEALEKIEQARVKGVDVTIDQYPYVAGSTFLSSLLPVWVHEGGTGMMLERLRNEGIRRKISSEMMEGRLSRARSWDRVLVTSVKTKDNKKLEGRTIKDIADRKRQSPIDTILDLVIEEENAVTMVSFTMSEEDVRKVMRSPLQMFCTDGIILGKPHPRAYGSFPRVFNRYVKEGVLRLEEAVRKMTSLPTQRFGLPDRGLLRLGMSADITVFNPDTIIDKATYQNPIQFPKGVEYVIVNGELAVDGGVYTGARFGRVLRSRAASSASTVSK